MSILDGALTTLAFCWRLERSDGAGLALTSCDRDLDLDDVAFRSAPGITPAAIARSLGLDPDSAEVAGAVSADCLSETDLALGRWNGASAALFAVDWTEPDAERVALTSGEIGEVSIEGEAFSAELRGAAAKLSAVPCPSTSAECRAAFGDRNCRVDLGGRSFRAKVTAASSNRVDLDRTVDETLLFGRLRYVSGENCGANTSVLAVEGATIWLRDRPRADIEAGTVVELREGCDKTFGTCVSRFANGVNFRGEPHLPGTDLLTRYPGR